jgi:hypothetical protein
LTAPLFSKLKKKSCGQSKVPPGHVPVEANGESVDVIIEGQDDFVAQMLDYENIYSFLPLEN